MVTKLYHIIFSLIRMLTWVFFICIRLINLRKGLLPSLTIIGESSDPSSTSQVPPAKQALRIFLLLFPFLPISSKHFSQKTPSFKKLYFQIFFKFLAKNVYWKYKTFLFISKSWRAWDVNLEWKGFIFGWWSTPSCQFYISFTDSKLSCHRLIYLSRLSAVIVLSYGNSS